MAPEMLERLRPLVKRPDRFYVGAVEHLASLPPDMDEADVAEHLEMLRHRGLSHTQPRHDVAHRPLAECEVHQDVAPAGFGNRIEDVG